METSFRKGCILYRARNNGPIIVAPHHSLSMFPLTRGDIGSERVSFMLTKKIGSSGIISNVPRLGQNGIDYYRSPANNEEALKMFHIFRRELHDKIMKFRKKYSFFAVDRNDYIEKLNTYNSFWDAVYSVSPKNPFFVFVHTQALRIKNFPSIVDVGTCSGDWSKPSMARKAVKYANKKWIPKLKKLKPEMKEYVISWAKIYLKRSIQKDYKSFSMKHMKGHARLNIEKDIKKASEILDESYRSLIKSLTWDSYMDIIERCIDKTDFQITYENTFNGSSAKDVVRKIIKKTSGRAIQLETSAVINELFPDISVSISTDIIKHMSKQDENLTRFLDDYNEI